MNPSSLEHPTSLKEVDWFDIIKRGNIEQAESWLRKGFSPSGQIRGGRSLLMFACLTLNANPEMIAWLLKSGCQEDIHVTFLEETALLVASKCTSNNIIKLLIEAGSDIHHQDRQGQTALIWAAQRGKADVCELLIKAGANIHHQDYQGYTCLMYLAQGGHTDLASRLFQDPAPLDVQEYHGHTALMFAACQGKSSFVQWLMEQGANVNLKNEDGKTAQELAALRGHQDIVDLI